MYFNYTISETGIGLYHGLSSTQGYKAGACHHAGASCTCASAAMCPATPIESFLQPCTATQLS